MSDQCQPGRIAGVWVKRVRIHTDDRGLLGEAYRADEPYTTTFAKCSQTTLTMSYPGVIKAFHWHHHQDDLWFAVRGMIQAVLHDLREDSPTHGVTEAYCMGELNPLVVTIPHGVAHGYRVLGTEPAWLMYHTSILYNAAAPDEERLPHDDPAIGFDWETRPR